MTPHADARTLDRVRPYITAPEYVEVCRRLCRLEAAEHGASYAIRLLRLSGNRGDHATSHGNVAVAVVRGNRVITVMLRRDTQPHTPGAYSVDRVLG